ncbi:MAG: PIN domain-containing protein [Endomicrobia bacterium]|nr:PIN domain-containing protein [Endomicrobiia bacterium]
MLNAVLIDAGPLIALFDKNDKYHDEIKSFISLKKYKFITTVAVIAEVSHMLNFNINVQIDFLVWIANNGIILCEIQNSDIYEIIKLTKKYSDIPMDFADASLIIAAQKNSVKTIISLDKDFDIYRLPGKVKIKNIFNANS